MLRTARARTTCVLLEQSFRTTDCNHRVCAFVCVVGESIVTEGSSWANRVKRIVLVCWVPVGTRERKHHRVIALDRFTLRIVCAITHTDCHQFGTNTCNGTITAATYYRHYYCHKCLPPSSERVKRAFDTFERTFSYSIAGYFRATKLVVATVCMKRTFRIVVLEQNRTITEIISAVQSGFSII